MSSAAPAVGDDEPVRFSIVTRVGDPLRDAFTACAASVVDQHYPQWEWCIVDDSSDEWTTNTLRELADADPRVIVLAGSGDRSRAHADALAVATGDFVVLLDHEDELTTDALGTLNHVWWVDRSVDFIYSDEDHTDSLGRRFGAFDKPDWSPERLLGHNYCGHLSAFRRDLLIDAGGFRSEFDGAEEYDAVLRVTERARSIAHVPRVLYHRRVADGAAVDDIGEDPRTERAGRRAVEDALVRRGIPAEVVAGGHGCHRVRRRLTTSPRVAIIVPTRGSAGRVWGLDVPYVVNMVDSLRLSTYAQCELLVVFDAVTPVDTLDAIKQRSPFPLQLIAYPEPFNYARKCNTGALATTADILLFLNDDIEVLSPGWIETMIGFLQDEEVGLVGPLLLLDNFLIQSAGHTSAPPRNFAYRRSPGSSGGIGRPLAVNREATGVTGACVAIRRDTFMEVGGFSNDFPLNYNDVDLCFKLLQSGHRVVWTPDARLFHFESKSRTPGVSEAETTLMYRLWGRWMARDAYLPAEDLPAG